MSPDLAFASILPLILTNARFPEVDPHSMFPSILFIR
ncbi:MAG: hypothetical protein ACI9A7_001968 [Cyclobacteriaceae bacterium]